MGAWPRCYTTSVGTSPLILTIIATIISIFLQPRPGRKELKKKKSVMQKMSGTERQEVWWVEEAWQS